MHRRLAPCIHNVSAAVTISTRTMLSSTTSLLRIPVISSIDGLGDAVRASLRTATCPASDLFRASLLEIIDIPVPAADDAIDDGQWKLTKQQISVLQQATIVLGDAHRCADIMLRQPSSDSDSAPRLLQKIQWMQASFAGVDAFQKRIEQQQLSIPSFTLTRAGGVMPTAMAQYVFGWIVALERKFFEARDYQNRREWDQKAISYRPFKELTVGILGFGDIGQEIGKLLTTAGFQVVGFKRNVPREDTSGFAHRVTNNLQHVLEQSDFIVSVLPSTSATRQLLHDQNLVHCAHKKPVFINVGRGDVVGEQALLAALDKNWISRAVLDVFALEPLPVDSKLWTHPHVHITPHVAAKSFPQDIAEVFLINLNLFLENGENPLRYKVDWVQGY